MKKLGCVLLTVAGSFLMTACDHGGSSFSLLAASQSFNQSVAVVNNKVDILFVVDNSGSMGPLQQNLVSNFQSFISNFQSKGYDFRIGVTTSDAYLDGVNFHNDPTQSKWRDGLTSHTGVFVITPSTPNLNATFVTNATEGSQGSGDERVFSSFRDAFNNPLNTGFVRPDSFLSVIILSDEDDFSGDARPEGSWTYPGGIPDHDYAAPTLDTVTSYVSFLDTLTNTTGSARRYNVSAITVLDSVCQQAHAQQSSSTIIGQRYIDLVNQTNGVLGSICDTSYAQALLNIQAKILELSTQFRLNRIPNVSTIVVMVNGVSIPQDPANCWTYVSSTNSIVFHGTGVPAQGASIQISFDPLTAQN